ncbi:MAG: Holliday junction resolvase RuvX [Clostridia bacterium]
MRIMAIDYGDARIGIAFSDLLKVIATGYETYFRVNAHKDIYYIADLAKEKEVDTIVFGLPLNMDGSEGARVVKTKKFAEALRAKTTANIVFQDERLSTIEAEDVLIDANVRRDKRKQVIDKVAATIILQSYMDNNDSKA